MVSSTINNYRQEDIYIYHLDSFSTKTSIVDNQKGSDSSETYTFFYSPQHRFQSFIYRKSLIGTHLFLANSEDPDEMSQNVTLHQVLHGLLR